MGNPPGCATEQVEGSLYNSDPVLVGKTTACAGETRIFGRSMSGPETLSQLRSSSSSVERLRAECVQFWLALTLTVTCAYDGPDAFSLRVITTAATPARVYCWLPRSRCAAPHLARRAVAMDDLPAVEPIKIYENTYRMPSEATR